MQDSPNENFNKYFSSFFLEKLAYLLSGEVNKITSIHLAARAVKKSIILISHCIIILTNNSLRCNGQ